MPLQSPDTVVADRRLVSPGGLAGAAGVSFSAFILFGLFLPGWGHLVLVASLLLAWRVDRELGRDLTLIGAGIAVVSTTSVEADLRWDRFFVLGAVLTAAVLVPLALDRLWLKRRAIVYPWRTAKRWNRVQWSYVVAVPLLGWAILPAYFIHSGAYQNWPAVHEASELARFFVGVNFVGLWDELFFICTCFALLRRHFPLWTANILQAVIFVSFLWELGYRSWGPLLTIPFALLQGWIFNRTRNLTYVVVVHLLFDVIVFLAIVHAHNPEWLRIFVY
ncbi:CPBP family intramembrane metalloprotease [Micrococcus terreus]|uniref:CPBP family intramembrane glutamic endopeptidase n=1 Tax=Micrococcus terreus TaxID=574650 RepID=UPI0021A899B7|nr:CPBP family intramembrane glutamic endopeptidase [Micrococcus terreus]MCT2089654.1 CPBP family intramembrane metalloprotease [Micrococcus terreus]